MMYCRAYGRQPCKRQTNILTVRCCRQCESYQSCELNKCQNMPDKCRKLEEQTAENMKEEPLC